MAGIPLKVSAKVQINMALHDISSVPNVQRFSHMYLPMLWVEIVSISGVKIMAFESSFE